MGNNKSRMTLDYPSDMILRVDKVSSTVLGKEIIKRCGIEGQHGNLNEEDQTTLRFLRAAISFISNANDMGADLTNAAFIISQPGREFIIQAGNGDWEFYFSEDARDVVHGHCVRKGPKHWFSGTSWKDCGSYVSNLFTGCSQSQNTTVQCSNYNRPLALTYEVQELTYNVTLPEVTEEETPSNSDLTDTSILTMTAK